MDQFTRIAIDTSKAVFTLHAVDDRTGQVTRRELRRGQVEPFFAKLLPTEVVMEACGGAHHWGRVFAAQGHTVRLIPPQYVKPFVKRSKNDRNDAAAISEAAARPDIRPVPVKSAEGQAQTMILSVRDLLVRQRTQAINALRGHAAEFGLVAAKGRGLANLLAAIEGDATLPEEARATLRFLGEEVVHLQTRIAAVDKKLLAQRKANPLAQLLATIPGVGPIASMTLALRIDATQFHSGRHFASWLGLTPREHSTGGKRRLGGITKAGDTGLRNLLVLGATSVISHARPGSRSASVWLLKLLARRPRKLAAVALANKLARIVWAMMTSGEAFRGWPEPAAAAA